MYIILTSVIVSFAAIPCNLEVSENSLDSYVSNQAVGENRISTVSSKSSQQTNIKDIREQFNYGDLLLYFFFLLICLLLLFQVWIDYNLPTSKKDYK